MIKIIHRVNTIQELKSIDNNYWVEVDLRSYGKDIILNHEPFESWDYFEEYLKYYNHKIIILNIKEAWIEEKVIELVKKFWIKDYFLLDVEFPYIYRASRNWNKNIAIRYSEDEVLEQALLYKNKLDYLFVDTNTKLPLDKNIIKKIEWFKTCLVSPDRWGREFDIVNYKNTLIDLNFRFDYVMVWKKYLNLWD